MAYTHGKMVVQLSTSITTSGTGDKKKWGPDYIPHIVRAVMVRGTSTKAPVTKPVISFRLVTKAGKSSVTGGEFANVTLASINIQGLIFVNHKLNKEVKPGSEVVLNVKTAATVVYPIAASIYVEPGWETPAALGTGYIKTVTK